MVNSVIFQGRLVRDVEIKQTQSQVSFTEFTIAWSSKYKEVEKKCFLRCKAWRSTAEMLGKYFKKGQEIVVEGELVTEEWESDGEKKNRTICMINKVNFCGSKADSSSDSNQSNVQPLQDGFMNIPDGIDEELPFS